MQYNGDIPSGDLTVCELESDDNCLFTLMIYRLHMVIFCSCINFPEGSISFRGRRKKNSLSFTSNSLGRTWNTHRNKQKLNTLAQQEVSNLAANLRYPANLSSWLGLYISTPQKDAKTYVFCISSRISTFLKNSLGVINLVRWGKKDGPVWYIVHYPGLSLLVVEWVETSSRPTHGKRIPVVSI